MNILSENKQMKSRKRIEMKFRILLKPDFEDGGFNASCPSLPGCHSQGDTVEEALSNIREAIELCLSYC
jgi:antitoxin HicB